MLFQIQIYINANLNCSVPVESCYYKKKLGVLCCHHCGMEITDNKILLDYSELCLKYNTVKPSCGGRCGEAINFAFALRSRNKPCLRESQNTFSIKKLCDKQFAKSGGAVLRLRVRVFRSFTDTRPAKSSRAGSRRIWRGGES